jgi:hypothetical protein
MSKYPMADELLHSTAIPQSVTVDSTPCSFAGRGQLVGCNHAGSAAGTSGYWHRGPV